MNYDSGPPPFSLPKPHRLRRHRACSTSLRRDSRRAAVSGPLAPKQPASRQPRRSPASFSPCSAASARWTPSIRSRRSTKFDNTVMDWSKEKNTDQPNLFAKPRLILDSPFPFKKYGQCGRDVSSLFPAHRHVRRRPGFRALHSDRKRQSSGGRLSHEHRRRSFPASRRWARGSPMASAPKIRIFPPSSCFPISAPSPSAARSSGAAAFFPPATRARCCAGRAIPSSTSSRPPMSRAESQDAEMDLLRAFNTEHAARTTERIPICRAASMPTNSPTACRPKCPARSTSPASRRTRCEMYGLNDPVTESFGKRCLMARKLVEKGVRFIQLYTPSQSWDGHTDIVKNHDRRTPRKPTSRSPR